MSKSRALTRLRRTLADLFLPVSVSYFILVHRESLQFVRCAGRRMTTLLEIPCTLSEEKELAAFSSQIASSHFYYGQPVGILMNDRHSFSFIKRYPNAQASKIRDDLKSLSMDGMVVNHVLQTGRDSTLVVAQGMDKDLLQLIPRLCDKVGINLLYVSTLPAYLALNTRLADKSSNTLWEFVWSASSLDILACKANGTAFYGTAGPPAGEASDQRQRIVSMLYVEEQTPSISSFMVNPKGNEKPLATMFRRGHNVLRQDRPLFKTTPTSKVAQATLVASNSLKLLTGILGIALVVLLAVWLVYRPSNSPVSPDEERYQTAYSDNLQLQRTADSLDAATHSRHTRRTSYKPAAVMSLFCQERVAGLWLNGLTFRRYGSDSLTVEAAGMARNSQTVFSYQSSVSSLAKSLPLALLSLHPEVVASSGQPDTVVSFKLGATVHETSQTE
jgi:hypothetical protein